jgi:hypothetical protein
MLRKLRSRLSYANVMATVAVFIALGGSTYAALSLPKNSVGTKQLKNGAVTNQKLRNGAVTGLKLALQSVTGANVTPNSLTGTQIDASTLGTVPDATHATNADQFGGNSRSMFQTRIGGTCVAGSAIQAVNSAGSVSCGTTAPNGSASGGLTGTYPSPMIAPRAIGTSQFAAGAKAPDSAKLGGLLPNDYGTVLTGRISNLSTTPGTTEWASPSGFTTANSDETRVSFRSPNHDLVARDLSVELTTGSPGAFSGRVFYVSSSSVARLACVIDGATATACTNSPADILSIPANSDISIQETVIGSPAGAQARFGFRLTSQ